MIAEWIKCFFTGLAVFVPAWLAVVALLKLISYVHDRGGSRTRVAIGLIVVLFAAGCVAVLLTLFGCGIRERWFGL